MNLLSVPASHGRLHLLLFGPTWAYSQFANCEDFAYLAAQFAAALTFQEAV